MLTAAVSEVEARSDVPAGTPIPPCIGRKAERCLSDTPVALIRKGLITSGDTLARILPQLSAAVSGAAIDDPELRPLYAAVYRAFRRRRSLLLLNLQEQVQLEELPWIAVTAQFRTRSRTGRDLARETLGEAALLTLTSFPHALVPNKLLQEFRALSRAAGIDLALVDELAADIFAGTFTGKFTAALERAAQLLDGSIYATYYEIDYPAAVAAVARDRSPRRSLFRRPTDRPPNDALARLCAARAGVELDRWAPAINGMVIEQQQILTTQNLAVLVSGLDLQEPLRPHLDGMAKGCFTWICKRLQVKPTDWHDRLIATKNAAYAWRQMLFYLALQPSGATDEFLHWADGVLGQQRPEFGARFRPALDGLVLVAGGQLDDSRRNRVPGFLGWCDGTHWLLEESG